MEGRLRRQRFLRVDYELRQRGSSDFPSQRRRNGSEGVPISYSQESGRGRFYTGSSGDPNSQSDANSYGSPHIYLDTYSCTGADPIARLHSIPYTNLYTYAHARSEDAATGGE